MKRLLACLTRGIVRQILWFMRDDEFLKLYEQWSKHLWCFVCSRVPGCDPNRADDVCQETWVRAWRSKDKFKGGNFKAWLFNIAMHLHIDEVRKGIRRPETPLSPANFAKAAWC